MAAQVISYGPWEALQPSSPDFSWVLNPHLAHPCGLLHQDCRGRSVARRLQKHRPLGIQRGGWDETLRVAPVGLNLQGFGCSSSRLPTCRLSTVAVRVREGREKLVYTIP